MRRSAYLPIALLVPSLLVLLALQVMPALYTLWLSFSRLRRGEAQFVGLANYRLLFDLHSFHDGLLLSLWYALGFVTLALLCALGLALLLSQRIRYLRGYLVLFMIPWIASDVVAGTMWRWLFQPQYGIVAAWLTPLGLVDLYTQPIGALMIVILASVWQSTALITLILLGALRTIPQELHEAAQIDGANLLQHFIYVTLPLIQGALFIALLLLTIRGINGAGLIYTTTSGGPGRATQTLAVYLLTIARGQGEFGIGAALSVLMLTLNMLLVGGYVLVYRRMRRTI